MSQNYQQKNENTPCNEPKFSMKKNEKLHDTPKYKYKLFIKLKTISS